MQFYPRPYALAVRAGSSARLAAWPLDLALCGLLAALALWVRLPGLLDVPIFTDETEEVRVAAQLAHGVRLPLTSYHSFIGPWHAYLTAAALRLVGFDILVARDLTLLLALGLVALTYALAREWGLGRPAAVLAGGFLATSGAHAIVGSHSSWSNCTTPFYTTLAVFLGARAVRHAQPRLLPATGLVAGLALETHPVALAVLIPLTGYVAWAGRRHGWWRSRWTALAVLAFLVALLPLLAHNLSSGLDSLRAGLAHSSGYQGNQPLSGALYLANLRDLLLGLGQLLASSFVPWKDVPADPSVWLAGGLGLAGTVWAARRGLWLIPLSLLCAALVLPLFNPKYDLVMNGRFILPLLPLLLIGQAGWLGAVARRARAGLAGSVQRPPVSRLGAGALGVGAVVLAAWTLLAPIPRTLAYVAAAPKDNGDVRALALAVISAQQPGERVLIDTRLTRHKDGHPNRGRVLGHLLELASVPSAQVKTDAKTLERATGERAEPSVLLVTFSDQRSALARLGARRIALPAAAGSGTSGPALFRLPAGKA